MNDHTFTAPDETGADDLQAIDDGRGIVAGYISDDGFAFDRCTRMSYDEALRFAEWLLAHAAAGGAERQAA